MDSNSRFCFWNGMIVEILTNIYWTDWELSIHLKFCFTFNKWGLRIYWLSRMMVRISYLIDCIPSNKLNYFIERFRGPIRIIHLSVIYLFVSDWFINLCNVSFLRFCLTWLLTSIMKNVSFHFIHYIQWWLSHAYNIDNFKFRIKRKKSRNSILRDNLTF